MKKILFTCAATLFFLLSGSQAQIGDRWDNWAERFSEKAERLAEKVATDAEKNANRLSIMAEDLAADFSDRFENGDINIRGDGLPKNIYFSSDQSSAYLGIQSDHISKDKAEKLGFKNKYGSYVSKVVKGSAAEAAGLLPFDYIYGVDDQRTSNNQNLSDILEDYEPGTSVDLFFIRKGVEQTVTVELGEYNDYDWDIEEENSPFLGVSPAVGERSQDMDGASVEVINETAASEMGLQNGDVIKSINGNKILDWDDVTVAIGNTSPGDEVEVVIEREGATLTKRGQIREHKVEGFIGSASDLNDVWEAEENEWADFGGAFLGVYIERISEKKARTLGFGNPYGSYVTGVIKGTAADEAGLMPLDYIYGLDEYRVGENQNLGGILKKYHSGDAADVHFYRKGQKMVKPIEFKPRAMEMAKERKDKCSDPFLGVLEMSQDHDHDGVKVKPVKNSTAMDMGLQEGDYITHINGYQMYDWMDIGIAIDMLTPGDKISVDYIRNGEKGSASKNITSYAEAKKCKDCDCGESEDIVFDLGNDFTIDLNPGLGFGRNHNNESRPDVSDVEVAIQDLNGDLPAGLAAKGGELSAENSLEVENLSLEVNSDIGMFELQFDLDSDGNTVVNVYNSSGRAIYEYDLGRFTGDFADNIDLSQNGAGTYYLEIKQDDKVFVKKIVLKND